MIKVHTIMDRINYFTDVAALRRGAFATISAIQDEQNKAVQYLGPAVAFVAMAEALGRDPHEDISRVKRMMSSVEGPFTAEVQAIRDYAKGEFLGGY